jgi:hypothetical protein
LGIGIVGTSLVNWDVFVCLLDKIGPKMDQKEDMKIMMDEVMLAKVDG